MKNILIVTNSKPERIEYSIVKNFANKLNYSSLDYRCEVIRIEHIYQISKILINIKKYDIYVFHSPLFFFYPLILILRFFNRIILGFIWDVYPVKIKGEKYDTRYVRLIADFLEKKSAAFMTLKLIPSEDFNAIDGVKAVFKFWPRLERRNIHNKFIASKKDDVTLKIIFSGQINRTRGLSLAYEQLKKIITDDFFLYVASKDELPKDLVGNSSIIHLGFLDEISLDTFMRDCHFGLISLDPDFDGPAFPSKTFSYIDAGLPVIYFGPVLNEFIETLELSGLGVNISNCERVDHLLAEKLLNNYDEKSEYFQNLNCIDDKKIKSLVKLIERL